MSLNKLPPMPSFSFVLTSPDEHGVPVEILALRDSRTAARRELHLSFQPKDDDPLMKTVDTRFAGLVTYDVEYSTDPSSRKASASTASGSRPPSTDLESGNPDDDDDGFSSTSTTEVELDSQFERDVDLESCIESETVTVSDDGESILGEEGSGLGFHRQPRSVGAQVPMLPPRRKVGVENGVPMVVLDSRGRQALGDGQSPNRRRQTRNASSASPSSRLSSGRFPSKIWKAFQRLWRRLRKVGSLVLRR